MVTHSYVRSISECQNSCPRLGPCVGYTITLEGGGD